MAHNRRFEKVEVEAAFKKMPTFSDATIDVADLDAFMETVGYSASKEQRDAYVTLFREGYNGKLILDLLVSLLGSIDDPKVLLKIHVTALDKDKDGFIDESEFKTIVKALLVHDPSVPKVDFTKFVTEADTNKDGKVSIDEAVEWFCKSSKN
ncbi:troponin C, skeletal muscle [Folsomia candida]|uniref:Calcium-binding protein 4 n=1 Tax=Folsomia candida TaxID=158441 RepID=A0A226DXN1_FOLCA|nr:troponin C, skeletal muscle [Folsomia candida]OXA49820.1 Calcium-binding protein 4 [Folsomia candida]